MPFEGIIYIEEKDRRRLNNRRFCCKKCMLKDRMKNGLVFSNDEYKCRKLKTDDNCYGLTIPQWLVRKYKLKPCFYSFECLRGEFIIYTKKKKGLKMMKLRNMGMKGYLQIGLPIDVIREYELQGKMFRFGDAGKKYLCYAKIDEKEVKR